MNAANINIGKLYDQNIANTYDQDEKGLLYGARELAFRQIEKHVPAEHIKNVLDLAAGTGESLIAMQKTFPSADLHGIDLSEEMLKIAKSKLDFNAIHDDVVNTDQHFQTDSVNLILMHFLTTFINGADVVANTAQLLQPNGYYSIVSSTFEAFPRTYSLAKMIFSDEFVRDKNPAPENTETIAEFCTNAGLEVVAVERFTKSVSFASFDDFYRFGMNSGFFAHILSHLDEKQIAHLSCLENVFPFEDTYCGSVVLARA